MSDVIVSYKDAQIASMNASGTKKLLTSGKYLEDDVSIAYTKPPFNWRGEDAELVQRYTTEEFALSDTDFATWTPSTTAQIILQTSVLGTLDIDTEHYEYLILHPFDFKCVTQNGATLKAMPVRQTSVLAQYICLRPSGLANLQVPTYNYNYSIQLYIAPINDYYNASGAHKLAYSGSYGIYESAPSCTFSSDSSRTPTLTVRRAIINARCSTTYMSTGSAAQIDQDESKFTVGCEVWRCKVGSIMRGLWDQAIDLYRS